MKMCEQLLLMTGLENVAYKYDNVNEARNTSIFNNSILTLKINATGTHDWLISLYRSIFEFNIELLNIDVFLASFTLSYREGG
jgi:hypothetical protein